MWTDEQLLAQGWTQEQINDWRQEQEIEQVDSITEAPFEIVEDKSEFPSINKSENSPDKIQILLITCMLVIAPLSLYSSFFTEAQKGLDGKDGNSGQNGTDGSSFHLVQDSSSLPVCDDSIENQIFFVADISGFEVCQDRVWSSIELTGPQGDPGQDGADGANGIDGANGTDGSDGINGLNGADGSDGSNGQDGVNGADGENGINSLIVSSAEPNGINCANGGTRVDTGMDDNGDNFLSPDEIDDTIFVCNGADGNDGVDGVDGANGSSTNTMMVARLSIAPAYLGCNGTGQLLQQGLDDGSGGGIAQNGILESGEIMTSFLICTKFSVDQVLDINPGASNGNPAEFVSINSTLYFTANNGTTSGIWSMDVNGNIALEYGGTAMSMRAIGSQLMFLGQTPSFDLEPFIYEPSNSTAWQIADIFPGTGSSYAGEFTLVGTTVYFAARDSAGRTGIGRFDLWAYETGNSSVWKVEADIQPREFKVVGNDLYFSAEDRGGVGIELWKHDTTTNSTFVVKDILQGSLSSDPESLVVMGTTIYMSATEGTTHGTELFAYETTNNSTWLAADIRPGTASSSPSDLVVLGSRVYFQATTGSHFEMWVYESSNNSFWVVTDFQSTSGTGAPTGLTVRSNTVYFSADDGTTGEELWAHNSINESTWQVIDLKPNGGNIGDIHVHEGDVYFAGEDNWDGIELWRLLFSREVTYV